MTQRQSFAAAHRAIAWFVTAIAVGSVPAQNWARAEMRSLPENIPSYASQLLDIDLDGDLDLASTDPLTVFVNDGEGHFTRSPTLTLPPTSNHKLRIGDVDGDGDVDLVASGGWIEARSTAPLIHQQSFGNLLECADFTGDGRADVLAFNQLGARLFVANPSGVFVAQAASIPPASSVIDTATADLDRDGDPDLLISLTVGRFLHVLRNDSGGVLTDVSGLWGTALPTDPVLLITGDFDRDGDADCACSGRPWTILSNDGTGRMQVSSSVSGPGVEAAEVFLDIDGDGFGDIPSADAWLRGNGNGTFQSMTSLPLGTYALLAAGDVDGDGRPDFFAGTRDFVPTARLFQNRLPGPFQITTRELITLPPLAGQSQLIDIDLDGDTDRVGEGFVQLNDGNGRMSSMVARWGTRALVYAGDVNGDGWPDVIVRDSNTLTVIRTFLRTGHLFWSDAGATTLPAQPMLFFDADGDGDDDLLTVGAWLARSNGAGILTPDPSPILSGSAIVAAVAGDFDGDGDLDVLAADSRLHMFVNDGTGTLTWSPNRIGILTAPISAQVMTTCDADGDGDLDAYVWSGGSSCLLVRNLGGGVLLPGPFIATNLTTLATSAGHADIDGDGDLDAVVQSASTVLELLNPGNGVLIVSANIASPTISRTANLIADLDGDGDPDLVLSDRVMVNRQWHAMAPYITRSGANLIIDFGSTLAPTGVAIPFAAPPLSRPLPLPQFGTLGIDPTQLLPLPITPLVGSAGRMSVAVPNNPAIVGFTLGVQAVISSGTQMHLTPPAIVTIE